jgi:hypothetical protein
MLTFCFSMQKIVDNAALHQLNQEADALNQEIKQIDIAS